MTRIERDTPSEKAEARPTAEQPEFRTLYIAALTAALDYIESMEARVRDLDRNVVPALAAELADSQAQEARLREAMQEARRCLTLIGHVPRSANTWADRCQAADRVLGQALSTSPDTGCPECGSPDPADRWGSNYDCRNKFHDPTPPDTETRGEGEGPDEVEALQCLVRRERERKEAAQAREAQLLEALRSSEAEVDAANERTRRSRAQETRLRELVGDAALFFERMVGPMSENAKVLRAALSTSPDTEKRGDG